MGLKVSKQVGTFHHQRKSKSFSESKKYIIDKQEVVSPLVTSSYPEKMVELICEIVEWQWEFGTKLHTKRKHSWNLSATCDLTLPKTETFWTCRMSFSFLSRRDAGCHDHPINLESETQLLQPTVGCFNWIVPKSLQLHMSPEAITLSHHFPLQTDRDVIASRPYGVRRSIFVALQRQCATAAPQWTSYLKRWVCGAVGCHFWCQKIVYFLLDFGFDMGKSGVKPTKKQQTQRIVKLQIKITFLFPSFPGSSELPLSFNETLQNVEMPPVLTRVSWVVWSIRLAICQWTAMPNINCHSRYGGFLSTAWSQKAKFIWMNMKLDLHQSGNPWKYCTPILSTR